MAMNKPHTSPGLFPQWLIASPSPKIRFSVCLVPWFFISNLLSHPCQSWCTWNRPKPLSSIEPFFIKREWNVIPPSLLLSSEKIKEGNGKESQGCNNSHVLCAAPQRSDGFNQVGFCDRIHMGSQLYLNLHLGRDRYRQSVRDGAYGVPPGHRKRLRVQS